MTESILVEGLTHILLFFKAAVVLFICVHLRLLFGKQRRGLCPGGAEFEFLTIEINPVCSLANAIISMAYAYIYQFNT